MKAALTIAIACACSHDPEASHEAKPQPTPAALDAAGDARAIQWPATDGASFLTVGDLAKTCGVGPTSLTIKLVPLSEPTKDAIGEDHALYIANVARATQPKQDHFMGIVVQTRETAEHASKLHASAAHIYKPVAGTNLLTHRLAQNDWVRREVHGLRDRFVYSIYETDAGNETVVCDDTELLALAHLLETRLP